MFHRLAALFLLCAALSAQQDGPYVKWKGHDARIYSERAGRVEVRDTQAPLQIALPSPLSGSLTLDGEPFPPDAAVFPPAAHIAAVSDVHGHLDDLLALLKAQGIVDGKLHWAFGRGHLVIAGDVVDRGDQVTQALWFIRELEGEALRAGGRVHLLLGNHEAMLMGGDLRYTAPLYVDAPAGMPSVVDLFGPDSEFGRWLRSKPALIRIGSILFVHGGLSPDLAARGFSLDRINTDLRTRLGSRGGGSDAAGFLLGPEGPLWFRGYFESQEGALSDAQVEAVLSAFKAKAIVVGHTTVAQVESLHGGQVYAIDAGLKLGRGELWLWEKGKAWRGLKDGRKMELE
ncbi:MAG: metallophosphoesterase [Acidobacteria bacterium]|nr:metallophosphoesterase [Acidobacteriota bacterium]